MFPASCPKCEGGIRVGPKYCFRPECWNGREHLHAWRRQRNYRMTEPCKDNEERHG